MVPSFYDILVTVLGEQRITHTAIITLLEESRVCTKEDRRIIDVLDYFDDRVGILLRHQIAAIGNAMFLQQRLVVSHIFD